MEQENLSQRKVAKFAGVSQPTVARVLNTREAKYETLQKLIDFVLLRNSPKRGN